MFSKDTYIRRRAELKRLVGNGVVVLFGNNEAPYNYPANGYTPMRQDSTFLYFFGQHRDGLVGVIVTRNGSSATISTWTTSCGWASRQAWPTWPPR